MNDPILSRRPQPHPSSPHAKLLHRPVRSAWLAFAAICGTLAGLSPARGAEAESFPVSIRVDASKPVGPLRQVWRFFGADEPNYATMKDGGKLLGDLGELRPKEVYFRTHNLLTSGDGTPALKWGSTGAYNEDAEGRAIYDWRILDGIFDAYLTNGVRPYAQIGFMPEALSTRPNPYRHDWRPGFAYNRIYTGWAYPPKDYVKWGELVHQWVRHCVERYGREEVEKWYWETWNEPDISYWRGTPEEFNKLHDYAIEGVRRALPTARVGGPDVTGGGNRFARGFYEHCLRGTNYATGKIGTPIDFVSFHAKGSPTYVNNHVRMGIMNQLRNVNAGFATVASFPELKGKPIIIGESDPEGCAACQGPQLAYRNGTMYSSYTAASFARKHDLADRHGVNFEGALTWAFTFEDQPYFAGFRQLASNGLPMPVLNVFRMFSRMTGQRIASESTSAVALDDILQNGVRGNPDVAAFASLDSGAKKLSVMIWHYHDDDVSGGDADVTLAISGIPTHLSETKLTHFRIDEHHSNSYGAWKRMGSPIAPNERRYAELEAASRLTVLTNAPASVRANAGEVNLKFSLPRQGVSLLAFEW
jgi:xylan 1,4-beta-xylosidase